MDPLHGHTYLRRQQLSHPDTFIIHPLPPPKKKTLLPHTHTHPLHWIIHVVPLHWFVCTAGRLVPRQFTTSRIVRKPSEFQVRMSKGHSTTQEFSVRVAAAVAISTESEMCTVSYIKHSVWSSDTKKVTLAVTL